MATLAKLIVSIGASTAEFESAIKQAQTQLKGFKTDVTALSPVFNAVGTAIKVVGTAIIGAFVGGGTAALVSAAKIEQYRLSLDTLMGSSKRAGEAVANAINLASKTPFTDEQLLAATVALEKFGQDARTVLPQVANMAAATNGDVAVAAESYGRFLLGQTKALSSYGINKAAVLKEGAITEQGIQIANQKGQIVNEAAYNAALLSLMDKRFADGAQKQANSISGLKTRLQDAADDALRTIAGVTSSGDILAGGLADTFKKAVTMIIAKIDEWKANGSLQWWASDVGNAITAFFNDAKVVFNWLVDIATSIARNWQTIVPVMAAVVGAFIAFKGVATYVALATTAIKLFGSAASIAALGPIAAIIGAVALLAAGITYLIEKQQQENALLNPSLVGAASVEHIKALTAAMAEYDAVTEKIGSQMLEKDQAGYYASRVAGHQKYVNEIKEQNDLLAQAALDSRNVTSKATEDGYAKSIADAKTAADAIARAEKLKRDAKTTEEKAAADKALKAAQALAAEVLKTNADLDDQLYKLGHTTVENQIYDLAKARDAAIANGGSRLKADKAYALESAKVYADAAAAKATAEIAAANDAADETVAIENRVRAAKKEAQDTYMSALSDYANKQRDVQSTLTQTIIDNCSYQENAIVNALEIERDRAIETINDQIDARNKALDLLLNNISIAKDAALGNIDTEIQAEQDRWAALQRTETVAGLRAGIAAATTPEDRLRAQKALDKELADEAHQDILTKLRKDRDTQQTFWDEGTAAAKKAAGEDLTVLQQSVKDTETAYNDPTTGKIASVTIYYDNLKLERNASAEAEKLLAFNTQSDILVMLQSRLGDWKTLGGQISDAMFGAALAAKAALLALGGTTPPLPPPSERSGSLPVHAHALGGYFTTPHIATIAEREPELIVPRSQFTRFIGKMSGNNEGLLRELIYEIQQLQGTVHQGAAATVTAIRG